MAGIIVFLIAIAGISLWIFAFVRLNEKRGSNGIRIALISLGSMIVLDGLLFLLIVVPTFDCTGFLCGLGELLIFFGLVAILLIVVPIVLLFVPGTLPPKNEGVIDNEL